MKTKMVYRYAAAAILIGILGITYFFKDNLFGTCAEDTLSPTIVKSNTIGPGSNKAVLTLEDGSQIALEKSNEIKIKNATSNGEKIIYKDNSNSLVELVYNYLTVPRGGQFFIELSDGTKVWLNSESQLKYPVNFVDGKDREVELVYGEAYFEVSSSIYHNGAKFKVFNTDQEVEVLGTEFNIKAYKDETNIYTTLVEGKVFVRSESNAKTLKPSQQYNLNKLNNNVSVKEVNIQNEIAWKDGLFKFYNIPIKDIMKVLSRWYDIEVEYKVDTLKEVGFNGTLAKDQNIEEILKIVRYFGAIEDYEIINKTVIIK